MKGTLPAQVFVDKLFSLLAGEPGVGVLYGPQGAYKTSLALNLLKQESNRLPIYIATGKHLLIEVPPEIKVFKLRHIIDDIKVPFRLWHLSCTMGKSLIVVYDSFIANFAGARGYLSSRAILKSLVGCLEMLRHLARRRDAVVVLILPRHPATGAPPLWRLIGRLVDRVVEIEVRDGVVSAVQRSVSLEPLTAWFIREGELRDYVEDP